jgi:hypothetical protein
MTPHPVRNGGSSLPATPLRRRRPPARLPGSVGGPRWGVHTPDEGTIEIDGRIVLSDI